MDINTTNTNIIHTIQHNYHYIFNDLRDPRVDDWFLMSSPWPTVGLCFLYYYIIRIAGPQTKTPQQKKPNQKNKRKPKKPNPKKTKPEQNTKNHNQSKTTYNKQQPTTTYNNLQQSNNYNNQTTTSIQ